MGPGKVFGELAILYNCTRTATVRSEYCVCVCVCVCLLNTPARFRRLDYTKSMVLSLSVCQRWRSLWRYDVIVTDDPVYLCAELIFIDFDTLDKKLPLSGDRWTDWHLDIGRPQVELEAAAWGVVTSFRRAVQTVDPGWSPAVVNQGGVCSELQCHWLRCMYPVRWRLYNHSTCIILIPPEHSQHRICPHVVKQEEEEIRPANFRG